MQLGGGVVGGWIGVTKMGELMCGDYDRRVLCVEVMDDIVVGGEKVGVKTGGDDLWEERRRLGSGVDGNLIVDGGVKCEEDAVVDSEWDRDSVKKSESRAEWRERVKECWRGVRGWECVGGELGQQWTDTDGQRMCDGEGAAEMESISVSDWLSVTSSVSSDESVSVRSVRVMCKWVYVEEYYSRYCERRICDIDIRFGGVVELGFGRVRCGFRDRGRIVKIRWLIDEVGGWMFLNSLYNR
ncbi:hypothetical protein Tco_0302903 [Tanacetum coccineum]